MHFRLPFLILLFIPAIVSAQKCVSGSCSSGIGIMEFENGERYEGGFENSKYHGKGIYKWPTGQEYNGYWKFGVRHGLALYKTKPEEKPYWTFWAHDKLRRRLDTLYTMKWSTSIVADTNNAHLTYGYTLAQALRIVGLSAPDYFLSLAENQSWVVFDGTADFKIRGQEFPKFMEGYVTYGNRCKPLFGDAKSYNTWYFYSWTYFGLDNTSENTLAKMQKREVFMNIEFAIKNALGEFKGESKTLDGVEAAHLYKITYPKPGMPEKLKELEIWVIYSKIEGETKDKEKVELILRYPPK